MDNKFVDFVPGEQEAPEKKVFVDFVPESTEEVVTEPVVQVEPTQEQAVEVQPQEDTQEAPQEIPQLETKPVENKTRFEAIRDAITGAVMYKEVQE